MKNVVQMKRNVNKCQEPKNYIIWSIANILCCNIILGVIALYFSLDTNSWIKSNRLDHAERSSKYAFRINMFTTFFGIIIIILLFVILLFMGFLKTF